MSGARTVMETISPPPHPAIEHPKIMPSGIYFWLPEEKYHAAFALSASGIKNLRISTLDFWARCSALNPDHEDEDSLAKAVGRAYDRRIVEGRDVFYARYAPEIDVANFPGALRTNDDLKKRCAELGLKVGGPKADLIARLTEADPTHDECIWDLIVETYRAKHTGKEFLPTDLIHKIEVAAVMIERHPQLCKAFSGGMPQVSVFWRDRDCGVPCKARFDYLKPRAIVDLKTFENMMGMPVDKAIARAVANQKYHIQAAFYLEAAQEARKLISAGEVIGEVEQSFLDALVMAEERTFLFVFQQKGIAPLARGKILPPSVTLDIGNLEVDQAKAAFARCWQTFGTDPWLDIADIGTFDPTEFPAYLAD